MFLFIANIKLSFKIRYFQEIYKNYHFKVKFNFYKYLII